VDSVPLNPQNKKTTKQLAIGHLARKLCLSMRVIITSVIAVK
jgi:hypothetical protein